VSALCATAQQVLDRLIEAKIVKLANPQGYGSRSAAGFDLTEFGQALLAAAASEDQQSVLSTVAIRGLIDVGEPAPMPVSSGGAA
jgi:hypothetical protein